MEKTKEQREKRDHSAYKHSTYKLLTLFACICVIIFAGANLFLAVFWGIKGIPGECSGEASLLSTGIGIIGFAIAVWAGLNISNIISRKEMDELKRTYKELKATTDTEIRPFVEQSREVLLQQFLVELERAKDDLITQYFARGFRDSLANEKDIPYAKLIEVEMISAQVALRHRSAYTYDETLIKLADEGIVRINNIQDCLPAKDYLTYRKADFMFYKGYCDKDEIESAKDFMRAVTLLTGELGYDSFGEKLNNDRALAYWNNMLGEAYSKIVHYYTEICREPSSLEKWKDTDINISYCADQAIHYCEKSVRLMDSSVYWRDLGCAYERKDRVLAHENRGKYIHSAQIIDAFLQSVSKALNDYGISDETGKNAFYVLLAYYHRYLGYEIERSGCVCKTFKKCASHISNMYAYASVAKLDFPRHMSFQKLYAFSCYYVYRALKLNIEIKAAQGKACPYFKKEIKKTLNQLEIVDTEDGKKDPFTAKLHEILEVME